MYRREAKKALAIRPLKAKLGAEQGIWRSATRRDEYGHSLPWRSPRWAKVIKDAEHQAVE
jgi:hypothetical protein